MHKARRENHVLLLDLLTWSVSLVNGTTMADRCKPVRVTPQSRIYT